VDVLAAELAQMAGATSVSLLIANFSGTAVNRLSHIADPAALRSGHNERVEALRLDGSAYQRVLFTQMLDVARHGEGWIVLVPVTERGDAIGILELSLPHRPDAETVDYLVAAAHALAYVLIASRRYTDLFEWAQRDVAFSVAAEIQRRLLPSSYTAEGGPFTLAGWLEPAHNAGGDTFDYSIDREYLYLSITDAMGHSTVAALLATLTVGSLRNSRRKVASPAEQADVANEALLSQARPDQFVTGQMIRVRLADGTAELVNAGHPPPYLLRDGRATSLTVTAGPPLGVLDRPYATDTVPLKPGDRVLLITDGYLERNAVHVDIEGTLAATVDRHPRQIVQELAGTVLDATKGNLRDDATVLCFDWHGPAGIRDAIGGASRARTTGA
jgi:serine phosphatase RsbU (regulator of sigma subunit)